MIIANGHIPRGFLFQRRVFRYRALRLIVTRWGDAYHGKTSPRGI